MIYMRSPVAIPALSAGEIQYTTHFASVLRSAVKGFPVRVILSTSDRQMFSLVAAKSIKSIADLKGLKASEERGRGNRTTIIEIGCSALIAHMSQFSVGRYKKAHRHAAGAQIIILEGAGYSLLWPEGSEAKRFDWQPNSVISPPDQWFHQHFNTSQNETRYLAIRWNSKKYKVFKDIVDRSVKEGGTQIEYEDEDPKVRQLFETELARRGIQSRMT